MIDTKYLYAALLLVILVVQLDGQQTGRRKSTDLRHHKHHLSKSPVDGHRSIGGNGIRHMERHSFLDRTIERMRKKPYSNRLRTGIRSLSVPTDGDPDSVIENHSDRSVIRIRSGSVGYMRLATPQWYRPVKFTDWNVNQIQFHGSIIVLTSDTVLISRTEAIFMFRGRLDKGRVYKISLIHHRDYEIENRFFSLSYRTGRPIRFTLFKLVDFLESGFVLFKLTDPYVRFPDRWLINWRVNYNRHGYRRYGYPEDKFRRPDLGCFGFMYTKMAIKNEDFLVNTEYPVSIISYNEDERTTVYANDGRFDYKPYSRLDEHYNSASPVFCGLEGRLRYFARRVNDTTLQLIPLHDIANDLKLLDRDTYDKLAIMTERRDRGDKEPGWMPDEQTPKWFRQMYRQTLRTIGDNRVSWYGGYMIVLTKQYFLVPDYVAQYSLDSSDNKTREWTHFHSREYPTKRENSFGDQPPVRQNQNDWPKFVRTIPGTNFSLYYRPNEDPAWNEREWFKINVGTDHTESNCNYLEHRLIGTSPEPDTRLDKRTPVFVIPKSCSDNFCYVTLDASDKSTKFTNLNPVMCEGYPAFFLMGNIGNNHRGWLVMKIEYLLKSLNDPRIYDQIVNDSSNYQKLPGQLYPTKDIQLDTEPPGWFKLMYDNSPSGGPMLGYAGSLLILSSDKFVASDYAVNNALLPYQASQSDSPNRILYTNLTLSWIFKYVNYQAPEKFNGYIKEVQDESVNENKHDAPQLDTFMTQIDMISMTGYPDFKSVELPSTADYNFKDYPLTLTDCYAYTYTFHPENRSILLFTKVPVQITKCDYTYCYGALNPFSQEHDLNDGVHAGAPIVCGNDLMFYNAPYPDHLYRAQFRIIRQVVIDLNLMDENLDIDVLPPPWYRILLSEDIYPYPAGSYKPKPQPMLRLMIVLNDAFFIGVERYVETAIKLSIRWGHQTWTLFNSTQEPTPRMIYGYYGKDYRDPKDTPRIRVRLGDTGLAVYQRARGFETRGGGSLKLSWFISKGEESREDCWLYLHRPLNYPTIDVLYEFTRVKVAIRNCENGFCEISPHRGLLQEAGPIVCGGILSYILQAKDINSTLIPNKAIQITTIYEQMKEIEKYVDQLVDLESMSEDKKVWFIINNQEWIKKIFPLYISRINIPTDEYKL